MQLRSLSERLTPGQARRRLSRIARRRAAGHVPPKHWGVAFEPLPRKRRVHYTMRSLAALAYQRGVRQIRAGLQPPTIQIAEPAHARPVSPALVVPSWRERLRNWRQAAGSVLFRMKRGQ